MTKARSHVASRCRDRAVPRGLPNTAGVHANALEHQGRRLSGPTENSDAPLSGGPDESPRRVLISRPSDRGIPRVN